MQSKKRKEQLEHLRRKDRWIVFYVDGSGLTISDHGLRYITYRHGDKLYWWGMILKKAHRFYNKNKALKVAEQKGGCVELAPECRYG
jgi:hypothetical protein